LDEEGNAQIGRAYPRLGVSFVDGLGAGAPKLVSEELENDAIRLEKKSART
jgi:hypothetical protein